MEMFPVVLLGVFVVIGIVVLRYGPQHDRRDRDDQDR